MTAKGKDLEPASEGIDTGFMATLDVGAGILPTAITYLLPAE
jgi:hypothetical protein